MRSFLNDYICPRMSDVRHSLRKTTTPLSYPVSLDEVKRALDLGDDTGSDEELSQLIPAAVEMVERDSHRSICTQTWKLYLDEFPEEIELRVPPVTAVSSVKYTDTAGVEQTVSSSDYYTDITSAPARVWPVTVWPSGVDCDRPNAVNVTFTAGYSGSIPKVAWLAIMAAVKALYNGCEPGDSYWAQIDRLRWGPS